MSCFFFSFFRKKIRNSNENIAPKVADLPKIQKTASLWKGYPKNNALLINAIKRLFASGLAEKKPLQKTYTRPVQITCKIRLVKW